MTVRTRFAPSPTGYLHIGGVRTALFCWLFARQQGGQFVLRIDDTDQERNVDEALKPILDGLRWLGIDWDEGPDVGGPLGPYYQSQRTELYQAAVERLLESGHAYKDYAKSEEVQEERQAAEKSKETFVYSRRWMAETPEQIAAFEAEGRQAVVRLKMPREGSLVIADLVRGDVKFDWAREQDHVIQRANGTFIYHLASVVDDYELKISHVIRAEEHLSNTPRQIFIAQSLGYELPQYAHLPVVAEPGSKTKLSKRKLAKYLKNKDFAALVNLGQGIADRIGLETSADEFNPVIVDFYREVGFLPEAVVNYLALLGWSLDDKTEDFSTEELTKVFTLDRVNKASASFDPKKLLSFQERHMNALPIETKLDMTLPFLHKAGLIDKVDDSATRDVVAALLKAAGDRIKIAGDILDYPDFFTPDDQLEYDEKAFDKRIRNDEPAVGFLKQLRAELESAEVFETEPLHDLMKAFLEKHEIKFAQVIHALRVATTGKGVGMGMFESLEILGRERTLARIDRALTLV
jgi:glutamyl-tRNA synthetase